MSKKEKSIFCRDSASEKLSNREIANKIKLSRPAVNIYVTLNTTMD